MSSFNVAPEYAVPVQKSRIPNGLLHLKPAAELRCVSMSHLARKGTALLRQLLANSEAVAVKIQGQGAMVTLSQQQYDDMVALIDRLKAGQADDRFTAELGERFDDLLARMNRPGAAASTQAALFADAAALDASYRPGTIETDD